jgi:hypothetical protein
MSNKIIIRTASRQKAFIKVALTGITGAGKTRGALEIASAFKKPIMIDSENGSGELYSHLYPYDYIRIQPPFTPAKYVEAIEAAVANGNDFLIIDSLSHAWKYVLDYKDGLDASNPKAGFANWRKAKKLFDETMTALLQSPIHICACMREKSEYTESFDSRGTKHMNKTGTTPIAEPDLEFEFTTCWKVDRSHQATATKDRTEIWDVATPFTITRRTGEQLIAWMNGGVGELIARPEWRSGMTDDEEAQNYLQEAQRMEVGSQNQKPVESYRDVIALWQVTEEQWTAFRSLTFPEGTRPGEALFRGYKSKLRNLSDVTDWVQLGCPSLEGITPTAPAATSPAFDDEPIQASAQQPQMTAVASGVVTHADGSTTPPPPPVIDEAPAVVAPVVEPVVETVASSATNEPEAQGIAQQSEPVVTNVAFGYKIERLPLPRQFEQPCSGAQIAMVKRKMGERDVSDDLAVKLFAVIAMAFGCTNLESSAAHSMVIDFLNNSNTEQFEDAVARADVYDPTQGALPI